MNQPDNRLAVRPLTLNTVQAGQHLGISSDAVRQRVKRGTLHGVKVGGRWRIVVASWPSDAANDLEPQRHHSVSVDQVLSLQGEVDFLRSQLGQADRERAELRQLFSQAQVLTARLLAAMLPSPSPDGAPSTGALLERPLQVSAELPAQPPDPLEALLRTHSQEVRQTSAPQVPVAEPPPAANPLDALLQSRTPAHQPNETETNNSSGNVVTKPDPQPALTSLQRDTPLNSQSALDRDEGIAFKILANSKPSTPDQTEFSAGLPTAGRRPHAAIGLGDRLAILDRTVAHYMATGWRLATKLDVRAEMVSVDGATHVYLEVQSNGAVTEEQA